MTKATKILIGLGISGGILAGVLYLLRLKRTGEQLETLSRVSLHKIDVNGIVMRVDATLKNPTPTKLKIKFPFVKLIHKDTVIGASKVVNKDITIPAFGETKIEKIMIEVPFAGIFSLAASLVQALKLGSAVKLMVKIISTVDLGFKKLPYESEEEVTLKKAQTA